MAEIRVHDHRIVESMLDRMPKSVTVAVPNPSFPGDGSLENAHPCGALVAPPPRAVGRTSSITSS
jgi:hypothetical protein